MATAAKMKFSMKPFSEDSFASTERAWTKRATGGCAFPTEAPQILDWARTRLNPAVVNDSIAYGIFKDGVEVASALCEVVLFRKSARSKWVKMMKVRLSPELEEGVFAGSLDTARDVLDVYAAAVFGVMRLKLEHDATTLKIYGRSTEQLVFLRNLGVELEKRIKDHKISLNGRWLVIENEVKTTT